MRTFVTCALLAATVAMFGTASAQAYDGYRHYHYYRRPVGVIVAPPVVLAPAPLIVAPPPVVVAQPPVVYGPAPVVVGPVIRPGISLRIGIGR